MSRSAKNRAAGVHEQVVACIDTRLTAVLDALEPLVYGAPSRDPSASRGFVRAASAVRRWGAGLVVAQDDVQALALHDDRGELAQLHLPLVQGLRAFEEASGTKHLKWDLEACAQLPDGRLLVLGSGSTPAREQLVVVDPAGALRVVVASSLYQQLREAVAFSGSELNVEGALVVAGELWLLQRGNGRDRGDRTAVNAIGRIPIANFVRWLDGDSELPALAGTIGLALGTLDGVALGLTDASRCHDGRVALVACAEASPDTFQDGAVVGCVAGYLEDRVVRLAPVTDPGGQRLALKVEGIEARPEQPGVFDVVVDMDNPDQPSLLGRLVLHEAPIPSQ